MAEEPSDYLSCSCFYSCSVYVNLLLGCTPGIHFWLKSCRRPRTSTGLVILMFCSYSFNPKMALPHSRDFWSKPSRVTASLASLEWTLTSVIMSSAAMITRRLPSLIWTLMTRPKSSSHGQAPKTLISTASNSPSRSSKISKRSGVISDDYNSQFGLTNLIWQYLL